MENFLDTIIISSTIYSIYTFYKLISNYEFFSEPKLYVKFNDENALMPYRATKESAGLDLFSCEKGVIEPHSKKKISIGISLKIPYGYYGRIAPRSGLTMRNSIDVGAGVIDSDYTGNISIILFNHGDERFIFDIGDKLAQLIVEKIALVTLTPVFSLENTDRGDSGFGSTGMSKLNIGIDYSVNDESTEEETSDQEETCTQEETCDQEETCAQEETCDQEETCAQEETCHQSSEESSSEEKEEKYVKVE